MKKINWTKGQQFNRLTFLKEVEGRNRRRRGIFRCVCGSKVNAALPDVRSGHTTSCGCYHTERIRSARSHGATVGRKELPEYKTWKAMKRRCYGGESTPQWKDYGGRGITVCKRWLHSFENFFADMGSKPSSQHSLDRINNNGNYSPNNCRWATRVEQRRNSSRVHPITLNGETRLITDWAKISGVSEECISARIRHGWDIEKAIFTPINGSRKINPLQKRVIKHARASGMLHTELAQIFNVSAEYVGQIAAK